MDKKKLGIYSYYASVIIAIVLLLVVLFFVEGDAVTVSIYRYLICYFSFGVVIPIGLIIREFLVTEYILKKMIIKIVVTSIMALGGVIGLLFVQTAAVGLVMFFVSLLALSYIIIPTVKKM